MEDWAWAKSAAREGSLGEVRVVEVEAGVGKPWNWEERSRYCCWREARVEDFLKGGGVGVSG